jgi:hypothetical protein
VQQIHQYADERREEVAGPASFYTGVFDVQGLLCADLYSFVCLQSLEYIKRTQIAKLVPCI